jgi:myosin X
MWFKGKQDFIFAGWMTKMGGGTSTLGRKSWKRRWFALRGGELIYTPSEEEDAEVLGTIDIKNCEDIIEVPICAITPVYLCALVCCCFLL